jgi:hypothetical protein
MHEQGFSGQRPVNQPGLFADSPIGTDGLAFLRLILPGQGWYFAGEKVADGSYRHTAFNDIPRLYAFLVYQSSLGRTMYHACAAFREPRVWNPRKNKGKGGWSWRIHDNVRALKILFTEIDTKESKPDTARYVDREEAYLALIEFCRAARLPMPMVVSSGGGLHSYWILEVELTPEQWQPLADGLKAACAKFGLDADPARTADASSVLRTPGTCHHKRNRIVEAGKPAGPYPLSAFEHLKGLAPQQARKLIVRRPGGQPSSDPAKIVKACRQLGGFAQNPGAYREPFHYLAAGVLGHCEGGEQFYLDLLDDEWKGTGQDKLEQWMDGGWGPATCQKFKEEKPGSCDGCPFKGKITSPIQLGTQAHARHSATAKRWRHLQRRRTYSRAGRRY